MQQAIESVLAQTVQPHEIIVVDDGSTDNSLVIASRYEPEIKVIKKANGGQASAFNAGFAAATGDWIWFLDADDWLDENAIKIVGPFLDSETAKLHAPLRAASVTGLPTGDLIPAFELSSGDVTNEIIETGAYRWPPTSGNIFARLALSECMPVPEEEYRLCADLYLCSYAAMLGQIKALRIPVGFYRIHDNNRFHGFRWKPAWLTAQATNILLSASLTTSLVKKYTTHKNYKYPYARRNLEMLMISKRFTDTSLIKKISKGYLFEQWRKSIDVKQLKGKSKSVGFIFWTLLSYAPLRVVKYIVKKGIEKNKNTTVPH